MGTPKVLAVESFTFPDLRCSVVVEELSDRRRASAVSLDYYTVTIQVFHAIPGQVDLQFTGCEDHYFEALKVVERLKPLLNREVKLVDAVRDVMKQWHAGRP